MTLLELTSHEAGLIVFENGEAFVENWRTYDEDCIPRLSPAGGLSIAFPDPEAFHNVKEEHFDDIREVLALQELNILADEFGDVPRLLLEEDKNGEVAHDGYCYTFNDGTKIYTFTDWN